MSLPHFDTQGTLFGSVGTMAGDLFGETDRHRLFARKIWPVLAKARSELAQCYCAENGRAGIEPVLLLGVLVFQFMERIPDRAAVEMVKYHLGWKLALNVALQERGFHATTLVSFRERLIAHEQGGLAFSAVLHALVEEGFVPKRGRQRLDSTHVLGLVARMGSLECVRETLRLALEELARELPPDKRPGGWPRLWERYVENKLDYRSHEPVLREKHRQAGADSLQLLEWLKDSPEKLRGGRQVQLLQQVFAQYYEVRAEGVEPVKVHAGGAIKNPHEPEAQWSVKGRPKDRKEWIGYKVQVAESLGAARGDERQPPGHFIGDGLRHRTLVVGEHHTELRQRRREQTTEAFKKRMHQRNGIEGTHSELIRGHGLRQARYRGKKKLAL